MGVTWLQTDESVREGYWIYSPPGNAGRSLNDDVSTSLPGLKKSLTRHPFEIALCVRQQQHTTSLCPHSIVHFS